MRNINKILEKVVQHNASDLHLKVGSPPVFRIDGKLTFLDEEPLKPEETETISRDLLPARYAGNLPNIGSMDFSYSIPGLARFRVNIFYQRGTFSLVLRIVKFDIPDFETLELPPVVKEIAKNKRGLVLVTGVTGSGKSTTLAAMIDYINHTRSEHIITIEDPIEFLYKDSKSIINQREMGIDFEGFEDALKRALRQDPDLILVGEMRDKETIRAAITACETGHMVFSTLHTADATQTVDRVLKYFEAEEQDLIRTQLSINLKAVISQRLLPRSTGKGRIAAMEILVGTPIVQKLILEGRTGDLKSAVNSGEMGMQAFDRHMVSLVKSGIVTKEDALNNVDNQLAFERNLKGGYSDGDKGGLIGF